MATKFDVSMIITSRRLSLSELAVRLERKPPKGSHEIGDPRGLRIHGKVWEETSWRENALDTTLAWHEQCLCLLREMPPRCVDLRASDPGDITISLDVAAFFEDAYFNIVVPPSLIGELSEKGIDFEITAYPVDSENDTSSGDRSSSGDSIHNY